MQATEKLKMGLLVSHMYHGWIISPKHSYSNPGFLLNFILWGVMIMCRHKNIPWKYIKYPGFIITAPERVILPAMLLAWYFSLLKEEGILVEPTIKRL